MTHHVDDRLELCWGDVELFRYVYRPKMPVTESPKPYFHPIRTLAGNVVTVYRPYDHVWHKGLQMTMAVLGPGPGAAGGGGAEAEPAAENFWGGPTYVHGRGYVQLNNNGTIEHRGWRRLECAADAFRMEEDLQWVSAGGALWLAEARDITADGFDPARGVWSLDVRIALTNVSAEPLVFGSPTTAGRPLAGYGGLFWRGPRSFFKGKIFAEGGREGPELMGQAAPWLAFTGRHDETAGTSTVVFVDHPEGFRYPTKWFVRNDPFAAVSFAFSFDAVHTLPPGERLTLRHRIVFADGAWTPEDVTRFLAG